MKRTAHTTITPLLRIVAFACCSAVAAFGTAQELEEIVVTAQKKPENLQDIALAVSAMQEEELNETFSGGGDVRALANRVPSLHLESSQGRLGPRLYLRGIGNVDFDLNASQPVSFVYDDVVLETVTAKSFPLFDLNRLEVLKGPQGTLFGRNTTAGILKVHSNAPSSTEEFIFKSSFGSREHRSLELILNGPLNENVNSRLSLFLNGQSNWIDNHAPGFEAEKALGAFEDHAVRLQFDWRRSEDTRIHVNLHARDLRNGTASIFHGNAIKQGTSDFVDGFKRSETYYDAVFHHTQNASQIGGILRIEHAFPSFTLVSISGYHAVLDSFSRGDLDGGYGSVFAQVLPSGREPGIPFDAQTADGLTEHSQFTQEIRLETSTGARDWRIGLYLFDDVAEVETFNFITIVQPNPVNGHVIQRQESRAWALFGTTDIYSKQDFSIAAGLRYSSDDKDFVVERFQSPLSALGVGPIGPLTASPSSGVLTWDLNALYAITPYSNLYARVAKGHRAPSIQGRLLFQDNVTVADAETSYSYEVGFKNMAVDSRLRLNGSAFIYQVKDFQLTKIGGTTNASELVNVDTLLGNGLELSVDFLLSASWMFTSRLSLNNSEIQHSGLSVAGCGAASLLYGCTVTDPPVGNGEYSIDGNRLYNSPKWIAFTALRYSRPLQNGSLEVSTDWAYRSEISFFTYENKEFNDEYALEGGVRVSYVTANGKHRIAFYGRNILDDVSTTGGIDFNNLTAIVNAPRTWGLAYELNL